ncbi:hypothetical protein PR048_026565 [Dryococelus australis]|uniref:Ig-like domain-containing protein n=1 Tax=Dryococelus australis TaxID=614101 RepID=A0ABQ9GLR7_9NEOP|nr:hypothetical protein PR048_026565 [Dryococelus australis]
MAFHQALHEEEFQQHVQFCRLHHRSILHSKDKMTDCMYDHFLRETLPAHLEDILLDVRRDMRFQHNGYPAHVAFMVRQVFNETFPNQWLGRGGVVIWPARSSGLTTLDIFLWRTLGDRAYNMVPAMPEDMQECIVAGCRGITQEILQATRRSLHVRLQMCMVFDVGTRVWTLAGGSATVTLAIRQARKAHSGNYTCSVGNVAAINVAVHILNVSTVGQFAMTLALCAGELRAAVHHGNEAGHSRVLAAPQLAALLVYATTVTR